MIDELREEMETTVPRRPDHSPLEPPGWLLRAMVRAAAPLPRGLLLACTILEELGRGGRSKVAPALFEDSAPFSPPWRLGRLRAGLSNPKPRPSSSDAKEAS